MIKTARELAETARDAWDEVARVERTATPDHGEWYGIAGDLVGTLRALEDISRLLAERVAGYSADHILRDDENRDPMERLQESVSLLGSLRDELATAERTANAFWSSIGHVGVEVQA